jgi:hypothetical protein
LVVKKQNLGSQNELYIHISHIHIRPFSTVVKKESYKRVLKVNVGRCQASENKRECKSPIKSEATMRKNAWPISFPLSMEKIVFISLLKEIHLFNIYLTLIQHETHNGVASVDFYRTISLTKHTHVAIV